MIDKGQQNRIELVSRPVKEGLVLDGNNGDSAKAAGKQDTDGKKYFSNLVY